MNGDRLRFPGSVALRSRVERKCGAASEFGQLGYLFGDWIRYGRKAPPATVAGVEPYLAAYLGRAESIGRRWGTAVGIGVGLFVAAVACVYLVIA